MSIKKLDDGRYLVDVRPQGAEGKRIRKKCDSKGEAQIYERYILSTYHNKPWLVKTADRRKLTELVSLWWVYHGKSHPYGENMRTRFNAIINDFKKIGVVRADQLTRKKVLDYRVQMLNKGLKPTTVNRQIEIFRGMFTKLINAEEFHNENPLVGIKPFKTAQTEMAYLTTDEVTVLLKQLEGDDRKVVMLCLATGGRWSEITTLRREHIFNGKVTFTKTKNGKRRSVPISEELNAIIIDGKHGKLFNANYWHIRDVLKSIKPELPKGQALHVLRHTFATHFMMNGGSIITLQRILGHANINQTMTYAHFAPDYLQDAIHYNPLAKLSI